MAIHCNTLFVGKVCIYQDQTASTQMYLQDLCAKTEPIEGTAILSYHQTAGKGQGENSWYGSAGKNIAVSLLLRPHFLAIQEQYVFNMAICLAVRDLVAEISSQKTYIKWPNDILVGHKKIAGILVNNSLQGIHWKHAIAGIGLNVNETHFPPNLPSATSISILTGKVADLHQITALLFEKIEQRYLSMKQKKSTTIRDEYNQHLYRRNEVITIIDIESTYSVILNEVSSDGRLNVTKEDGSVISFLHNVVKVDFGL